MGVLTVKDEVWAGNERLAALAVRAREEFGLVERAFERTLRHAIALGEILLEAKRELPRGGFGEWVEEEVGIPWGTGSLYMRLAHYQDVLPAGVNQKEAQDFLKGLPAIDGRVPAVGYPESVRDEARRLRKEGLKFQEVSDTLQVPVGTIARWVNGRPYGRGAAERAQTRRRLERIAKREEKRREAEKAARLKGGSIAAAYSLVRRLAQELDRSISQEADRDARRQLKDALTDIHAAETHVCTALGVDYGKWRDVG